MPSWALSIFFRLVVAVDGPKEFGEARQSATRFSSILRDKIPLCVSSPQMGAAAWKTSIQATNELERPFLRTSCVKNFP